MSENHTGRTSDALARKIVALLNADPGVASINGHATQRGWRRGERRNDTTVICLGCQVEFTPQFASRQYCSRACWRADPNKGRRHENQEETMENER